MELFSHIKAVIGVLYIVFIAINIILVVHDKRDPIKALSWITVMVALPVMGLILYLFFGRNLRKKKLFDRKETTDLEALDKAYRQQVYDIANPTLTYRAEISQNKEIITLLLNNSKALLTLYNKIEVLNTGEQTFERICEALESAYSSIHLEYYIFEDDTIGNRVAKILMAKAQEGVEVRLIYDDVGSWGLSSRFLKQLTDAGVQVRCFMPVVFPWLTSNVNYRNHRKIVVVDGKVAFTGGVNVADRYLTGGVFGMWRDAHLRFEGEAAQMLQLIFATDWHFVSSEKLLDNAEKYLPPHSVTEQHFVQIATSGPDSDWASIMQAFFAAINKAQHHIYISTPYFLPNEAILTAIKVAALSGIDVRLMMPDRADSKIVYWASRSYIGELIEAGVKVYLFQKGFNHSKLVTIDGVFASIGSANMDIRSFEDNFEVTAFIYDSQETRRIEQGFVDDLEHCRLVTSASWKRRPWRYHTFEAFSRLFSPLL